MIPLYEITLNTMGRIHYCNLASALSGGFDTISRAASLVGLQGSNPANDGESRFNRVRVFRSL